MQLSRRSRKRCISSIRRSSSGRQLLDNAGAPLALIQLALPLLRRASAPAAIVNVTSDAAHGAYEGWGLYGASKAALEQLGNVLAAEEPGVRVSTRLSPGRWVVEFRRIDGDATTRWGDAAAPVEIALGEGTRLRVIDRYRGSDRLYVATLDCENEWRSSHPGSPTNYRNVYRDRDLAWINQHGRPIRYRYVERAWPLAMYRNVIATEAGGAEMPSAGRPFTPQLITRLVAKGVMVAPIVLHTGVASLEADELPFPEYCRVSPTTAALVNLTRENGGRVIAVGTTVVRALESAADSYDHVEGYDGWIDLVVTPERGVRCVDGLITGWHEPEASHLLMLEAIAGRELLERSYDASLAEGYLWHEFGDTHLIVP